LEEQPIWRFDKMFQTGVRAHYTTTRAVAPLLRQSERGLVINISAGDEHKFLGDVQYDFAKEAVTRLGYALSRNLAPDGVLALTILPGFTRTERVEAGAPPEALASTHTPRFVGRAVMALYNDPQLADRNGGSFKAGQLGLDYGFTDVDGSQPDPFEIPEV